MSFFVTLPWTCLCGVASALARTIKVLIAQDRIVDLEKGPDNNHAQQDTTPSGPLAAIFPAEVLITMRRTVSAISQSIYRLKGRKTAEVDVEKGDSAAELISHPTTALKPHQSMPKREDPMTINDKGNESDSSSDYDNVSQSLSISSILDLMPIPVTTPEERAFAASILAARAASPSPPNTPSLISPCTDSSHDSSFAPELDVSSVLNTPLTADEPMLSSPIQLMCLTPFLEQQSAFPDLQRHELPVIDEDEEYNTSVSQEVHDPWTGETGFNFPRIVKPHKYWKKRNILQFTPPFPVVEEEEEEAIESRQFKDQIRDSPWDDGINESYGLKGRAFWRQAMRFSHSGDEQLWINNGLQVVAN